MGKKSKPKEMTLAAQEERKIIEARDGIEFVIQSMHADGFIYWWGGIAVHQLAPGRQPVQGSMWSAYWADAVKFPKRSLAQEVIEKLHLDGAEVLRALEADFHLAFDLDPARVQLFLETEKNMREETERSMRSKNQ